MPIGQFTEVCVFFSFLSFMVHLLLNCSIVDPFVLHSRMSFYLIILTHLLTFNIHFLCRCCSNSCLRRTRASSKTSRLLTPWRCCRKCSTRSTTMETALPIGMSSLPSACRPVSLFDFCVVSVELSLYKTKCDRGELAQCILINSSLSHPQCRFVCEHHQGRRQQLLSGAVHYRIRRGAPGQRSRAVCVQVCL